MFLLCLVAQQFLIFWKCNGKDVHACQCGYFVGFLFRQQDYKKEFGKNNHDLSFPTDLHKNHFFFPVKERLYSFWNVWRENCHRHLIFFLKNVHFSEKSNIGKQWNVEMQNCSKEELLTSSIFQYFSHQKANKTQNTFKKQKKKSKKVKHFNNNSVLIAWLEFVFVCVDEFATKEYSRIRVDSRGFLSLFFFLLCVFSNEITYFFLCVFLCQKHGQIDMKRKRIKSAGWTKIIFVFNFNKKSEQTLSCIAIALAISISVHKKSLQLDLSMSAMPISFLDPLFGWQCNVQTKFGIKM